MPLYPFVCDECGEQDEARIHMDQRDEPRFCPRGHRMRRLIVFPMAEVWAGKFHDRASQKDPKDGTGHLGPSW